MVETYLWRHGEKHGAPSCPSVKFERDPAGSQLLTGLYLARILAMLTRAHTTVRRNLQRGKIQGLANVPIRACLPSASTARNLMQLEAFPTE